MNKNKELLKNTIIIFIGKFCTQFISFLLIPLYTKYLITSDYGYVDLIQTFLSLIVPVIILRMDASIFRFLVDERKDSNNKSQIITTTFFILIIQFILFTGLYIVVDSFYHLKYGIFIIVNIIFMALSNIFLQISRGIGDNISYSIGSIICAISTVLFNFIFIIFLKWNAASILISSIIGNMTCAIYLIIKNKIYKLFKKNSLNIEYLKKMLLFSLPMIPDGISWWIVNVSDRSLISAIMGASFNGIYAISCKFSNILSSLFQIFNITWQESASLHINDCDRDEFFSNILNTIIRLFTTACLILMGCLPYIFFIIVGKDYQSSYKYIPVLLLGNIFSAIANVIGAVYIANKNTKQVAKTTIIAALVNIIINFALIKKIGLWAAAISTLISYILLALYRYIDCKKYIKFKINNKLLITFFALYIISYTLYYMNNFLGNIINFIIVINYLFIINKNYLKTILITIKTKYKRMKYE